MNLKRLILLVACIPALQAVAGDDFGIWTEATLQKQLGKKFSVDAGVEFRSEDKVRRAARWGTSVGVSYKPFKFLSFSTGYLFLHDYTATEAETDYKKDNEGNIETDGDGNPRFNGYNVDHAFWRNKHRAVFDVTGKVNIGHFTLSLRERYQYTHYVGTNTLRDRYRKKLPEGFDPGDWSGELYSYGGMYFTKFEQAEKEKKAKDKHYLRSRLQLEYNIDRCPWTPYVSYELSNNLGEQMDLDKTRLTVGAEWKITKKHRLDLAYLYEDGYDDDSSTNHHVISVGYKFKF